MRTAIYVYENSELWFNTSEPDLRVVAMEGGDYPIDPAKPLPLGPGVYKIVSRKALTLSCDVRTSALIAVCRGSNVVIPTDGGPDVVIVTCDHESSAGVAQSVGPDERDIVPEPGPKALVKKSTSYAEFLKKFLDFFWNDKPANDKT